MRKMHVRLTLPLILAAAVTIAFAAAPALAQAQAPGSLAQLGGSDSCIATGESECPTVSGDGLNGSEDVAVSPGRPERVCARSRTTTPSPNSLATQRRLAYRDRLHRRHSASEGSCDTTTGNRAYRPDSRSRSARTATTSTSRPKTTTDIGAIAEFTRDPERLAHSAPSRAASRRATRRIRTAISRTLTVSSIPALWRSVPTARTSTPATRQDDAIADFTRDTADGSLTQLSGANACIQDASIDSDECCVDRERDLGGDRHRGQPRRPERLHHGLRERRRRTRDDRGALAQLRRLLSARRPHRLHRGSGARRRLRLAPPSESTASSRLVIEPATATTCTRPRSSSAARSPSSRATPTVRCRNSRHQTTASRRRMSDPGLRTPRDRDRERLGTGDEPGRRGRVRRRTRRRLAAAASCEDVAEFTRNADGSLTQLASPDNCIQDASAEGDECRQRERPRPRRPGRGHLAGRHQRVRHRAERRRRVCARTAPATLTVSLRGIRHWSRIRRDRCDRLPDGVLAYATRPAARSRSPRRPRPARRSPAGAAAAVPGTGTCQVS